VTEPYTLTVGAAVATAAWLLGLTAMTFALWFHRDGQKTAQTGKTAPTRNRPVKPPQRPQDARKPPPGSPSDPPAQPQAPTAALKGSGPLPRDRPPPPRQWVDTHPDVPATTDTPAITPETDPAPPTEDIRTTRARGRYAEGPGGTWGYQPPEEKR